MWRKFVALKTFGDGNCCFRAASFVLFGNEEQLRVRTIVEPAKQDLF